MDVSKGSLVLGVSDEWDDFQKRNPAFVDYLPQLLALVTDCLSLPIAAEESQKETAGLVHFMARTCWEEMHEVVLLAGNGFGIGAFKMLRSMYERVVTAAFIAGKPEQAKRFLDFRAISQRRLINNVKTASPHRLHEIFPPEALEHIEAEYQRVLPQFEEAVCKKCKKTTGGWSTLDLASMAAKAGYELDKLYFNGSAVPTQFIHTSMWSMNYRLLEKDSEEKMTFKIGSQRMEADIAANAAHFVLLQLLNALNDYFEWNKGADLNQASTEYMRCWNKPPGTYPVSSGESTV